MRNWIELIEEKREEILKAGKEAYKEAMNNTNLRYIVEINQDGNISIWYDVAGGNSFHLSTYKGESVELLHFCFQYYSPEYTKEDIYNKFEEKGILSIFSQIEESASDNCTSVESEIRESYKEYVNILDECQQEAIDFEIDELSPEYIEQQLDETINNIECEMLYKKG